MPKRCLFVFGAGATRGSCLSPNPADTNTCLPPLDGDFFTQLQQINNPKHEAIIERILVSLAKCYGVNYRLGMEAVFTNIEHMQRMYRLTDHASGETAGLKPPWSKEELNEMRTDLLQAIAAVLEESLCVQSAGASTHEMRDCPVHEAIVRKMEVNDRIISFNYDCLLDNSLQKYGDGKWNAHRGYGFNLGARGKNLKGDNHWQPAKPAKEDETIRLLKLHGSLHFDFKGNQITLKQRPYTRQRGNLQFAIIPPESNKAFDKDSNFRDLWLKAGEAVSRATTLVLLGYSLPPTDSHTQALFRLRVREGSLKKLVIANPDRDARSRIRDTVRRGISPSTRVLVFDSVEEFSKCERSLWDRA